MAYFNFWFVILIGSTILTGVRAGADHFRLLNNLFDKYQPLERPVLNENDTVNLKIGVTLLNILELNTVHQYLESNFWMTYEWNDVRLSWNTSDYGGINALSIPPHRIWKPDIHLYNSLHPEFDATYQTLVVVKHDGNCTYVPPAIHKTSCVVDLTFYPFDTQSCQLKFGSWTYDGGKIDLQLASEVETGDLSSFVPSPEWSVIEFPAKRNQVYYQCCPDPYIDVTFTLKVKRRGDQIFSGCTFALAVGTVATLFSLLLPPTSSRRLTLGLVTALITFVLGFWINTNLGGEPSVLGSYKLMVNFFYNLAILTLTSVVFNGLIIYVYTRNPTIHQMPFLLRKIIFDYISPFLLLKRPTSQDLPACHPTNTEMDNENREQVEVIVSDLEALVLKIKGQRTQTIDTFNDWQFFGIILNRFTFIFFTIAFFVFFISYFSKYS